MTPATATKRPTVDAERDLYATGQLAAYLQRSVNQITRVAEELGIVPAFRINGVPHYNANQVDKLTDHFREHGK